MIQKLHLFSEKNPCGISVAIPSLHSLGKREVSHFSLNLVRKYTFGDVSENGKGSLYVKLRRFLKALCIWAAANEMEQKKHVDLLECRKALMRNLGWLD